MAYPPSLKPSHWIKAIAMQWTMLAPPHRLLLITVGIGALFTASLAYVLHILSAPAPSSNTETPAHYGLVSQTAFLGGTPIDLLHFDFRAIPREVLDQCSDPVTLADSHALSGYVSKYAISKHHFLCWNDLAEKGPAAFSIRRGYRVVAVSVDNPEITSYLPKGSYVDVLLSSENNASTTLLEHVRMLHMQHESDTAPLAFLELTKRQIYKLQNQNGTIKGQILLKNPKDTAAHRPRQPQRVPKIHAG